MASGYIRGMQGEDPVYLKTIPTLKHFLANNSEVNRYDGSSDFDNRTLREYYAKPFEEIIREKGIGAVMTAYNGINGVPVSANKYVVDDLLRKTWVLTA